MSAVDLKAYIRKDPCSDPSLFFVRGLANSLQTIRSQFESPKAVDEQMDGGGSP